MNKRLPLTARPFGKCRALILTASAAALLPISGRADQTWNGSASTNWSSGANWTSAVPTSSDTAIFSGTPTTNQPQITLGSNAAGLLFSTATGGWTLSGTTGKTLQLEMGGISTSGQTSGTDTVSAALKLDATQTWQAGTGGTLAVSGVATFTTGSAVLSLGSSTNTGTVQISGASAFVNRVQIQGGTVQLAGSGTLGSGSNIVQSLAGTTLDLNGINLSIGGTYAGANGNALAGTLTNTAANTTATLTVVPNTAGTTFSGLITDGASGTGKVAIVFGDTTNGTNTSTFGSATIANTYSGGTTFTGGRPVRATTTGLGTGSVTLNGGTNLSIVTAGVASNSTTTTTSTVANNFVANGTNTVAPTLAGTAATLGTSLTAGATFSGAFTGAGTLKVSSTGTSNFTGDLSGFTGTFDVENSAGTGTAATGSMAVTTANLANANLTVGTNGSFTSFFTYNGTAGTAAAPTTATVQLGSLSGGTLGFVQNGNTAFNTATFQTGALNSSTTYAGVIRNYNGTATTTSVTTLEKVGTGTLTLSGANTYTGETTVTNGVLLINGMNSGTGAVNVNASTAAATAGTLGGTGSVAGMLTVSSGAALSPGATNANDIGTFSAGGGLTLNGTYVVDLGTTATSTDLTAVTGALTLSTTTSLLNVRSLASGAATGTTYEILTSSTALTTTFANLAKGSIYTDVAGDKFTVNYNDMTNAVGDVSLTLDSIGGTAVPEPSTDVGCLFMVAALGWRFARARRFAAFRPA